MHKAAEWGACLEWSVDASVAGAKETKRTVEGDEDGSVMGEGGPTSRRKPGRSLILSFCLRVV